MLGQFGTIRVESVAEPCRTLWRGVREVEAFHAAAGDVWRLSVRSSEAPGLVVRAGARQALYDWGGGLVWLLMAEGEDLRARLGSFAGHATLMRASDEVRRQVAPFQPESAALAAISAGLRARFDPKGILNAGLMG